MATSLSPFAKHGHRWTEAEMREFIGMWMRGDDSDAIASHFKVTQRTVYKLAQRIRREGVPLPKRNQGHIAGRHNKPWTQEEVEYLVRRRNDRANAAEIGKELDRTHAAVAGMIGKLRQEGVNVRMLGHGVRRLWNPASIRLAMAGRCLRVVEDEADEAA